MTRHAGVTSCSLAGLVLIAASLPARADPSASDVVSSLQGVLLATMMDGPALGFAGRYARLEPAIRQSHDLETISRIVVGRHWRSFTAEQRALFGDTFAQLSIATYAGQFSHYSGEAFEFVSAAAQSKADMLVRCHLIKSDGGRVQFDYVLRDSGSGWRILNIFTDGVSDLALKRAEYAAILENEGFDALIAKLNDAINRQRTAER